MNLSDDMLLGFADELIKIAEKKDIKRQAELWHRLVASSKTPVNVVEDSEDYGGGYYDTDTKSVGVGAKDPETLAHELGHAEMDKGLWHLLQNDAARKLFPWTPLAGALGGALLSKGKKWGALLPVLTAAPNLLTEWLATRKGATRLSDIGATPEELAAYRKNLHTSFRTYTDQVVPKTLMAGGAGYILGSMTNS